VKQEKKSMKTLRTILSTAVGVALIGSSALAWVENRFASSVVSSANIVVDPSFPDYQYPSAALGKPTTWIKDPGNYGDTPGVYARSIVCQSCWTAPDLTPLVVRMGTNTSAGEVVVAFDQPIVHDAGHWYGKDFIVLANAFYQADAMDPTTDMESIYVSGSLWQVSMTVSVSPDLISWYTYPTNAGGYWPGNAFVWDRTLHVWGDELDPTKPVDPALAQGALSGHTVADAIDLYKGSEGGTAFDLSQTGFTSIKYIKLSGKRATADAVARVSRPLLISDAKQTPDGVAVSLGPQVVSAGSSELGDCFYIESQDRSCGIKVMGKTAQRGSIVTVSGVLGTVGGERVLRCTWIGAGSASPLTPVCLPNKSIGGADYGRQVDSPTVGQKGITGGSGLNTIGQLVRTTGRVTSSDAALMVFTINDGSTVDIKCKAPTGVTLPAQGDYVAVTGICSSESNAGGQLSPLLRVRAADDTNILQHQ
jgi:hypothetical protein